MKILYIEDNDVQGEIVKRMLEMLGGHQVTLVECGREALEVAKKSDGMPDVIITDRRLPKMTGPEIITAFKNEPSLAHIPIIMLSADLMKKAKSQALEAGADAFLSKPVDFEQLNTCIKELVRSTEPEV